MDRCTPRGAYTSPAWKNEQTNRAEQVSRPEAITKETRFHEYIDSNFNLLFPFSGVSGSKMMQRFSKEHYTCLNIDGIIWGLVSMTRPNVFARGPNCIISWRNGLRTGSPNLYKRNMRPLLRSQSLKLSFPGFHIRERCTIPACNWNLHGEAHWWSQGKHRVVALQTLLFETAMMRSSLAVVQNTNGFSEGNSREKGI